MTYTTLEFDNWPIERVEVDRDSRLMSLTFSTKEAQYTFLEAMVKFARERGLLD